MEGAVQRRAFERDIRKLRPMDAKTPPAQSVDRRGFISYCFNRSDYFFTGAALATLLAVLFLVLFLLCFTVLF